MRAGGILQICGKLLATACLRSRRNRNAPASMADEFFVPASPEELLDDDVGGGLKVSKDISLADLDPEDIYELAESEPDADSAV